MYITFSQNKGMGGAIKILVDHKFQLFWTFCSQLFLYQKVKNLIILPIEWMHSIISVY